jgi:hypothetical protein
MLAARVDEYECDGDFTFSFAVPNGRRHGHRDDIADYQDETSHL